jgi:Tol biopolymer transport system component
MAAALTAFVTPNVPVPVTSPWRWLTAGPRLTAAAILITASGLVAVNVGGWRDRLLGRPGNPGQTAAGPGAALADRSFAVRQVLRSGEYSYLGTPSLDGRYFPFLDGNLDVVVKELDTGRVRRLTNHGPNIGYAEGTATISPDNHWVAYPWVTPAHDFELRLIGLDEGAEPRVILRRPDLEVDPLEWSEDGTQILALIERKDLTVEIALVAASDGTLRPIKALGGARPQRSSLSPDGRFVAYDRPQQDNPRVRDIYVIATDGSGEWPLVEHPANDLFPLWSSDGDRLFFASDRTGALGLWMIHLADGHALGEPEVVSVDMGRMNPVGLTRSGEFYYHLKTGLVDAYTVSIDPLTGSVTGKPQPVAPNYIGSNISSNWSPDGRYLAYVSIRSIARNVDRFSRTLSIRDMETGQERGTHLLHHAAMVTERSHRPRLRQRPERSLLLAANRRGKRPRHAHPTRRSHCHWPLSMDVEWPGSSVRSGPDHRAA